jgi:hypothetical protein
MGVLFGTSLASEIDANDMLSKFIHIENEHNEHRIDLLGLKGPDESPLVKSIIEAAN